MSGSSGNPGWPSTVGGFVSVSGGVPRRLFASAGDAPGLFFHGTADNIVPSSWSVDTAIAMLNAGVIAFLELQDGAGHVPWAQYRTLYLQQADWFLYWQPGSRPCGRTAAGGGEGLGAAC